MYYWFSTLVAIPCLFDSITCFVSYILSPLHSCLGLSCFATSCSVALSFVCLDRIFGYALFVFKEFEIPYGFELSSLTGTLFFNILQVERSLY